MTFGPQGSRYTVSYPDGAMLLGVIGIGLLGMALCRWVVITSFFGSGELLAPFFAQIDAPAEQVDLMLGAVCLLITSVFMGLYFAAVIITLRRIWDWLNAPVRCPAALVDAFERTTHNIAVCRVQHQQRSELVRACNQVLATVNAVTLAAHDDALFAEATAALQNIDQRCMDLDVRAAAETGSETGAENGCESEESTSSRKSLGPVTTRQGGPGGVGAITTSVATVTTSAVDTAVNNKEKQS